MRRSELVSELVFVSLFGWMLVAWSGCGATPTPVPLPPLTPGPAAAPTASIDHTLDCVQTGAEATALGLQCAYNNTANRTNLFQPVRPECVKYQELTEKMQNWGCLPKDPTGGQSKK